MYYKTRKGYEKLEGVANEDKMKGSQDQLFVDIKWVEWKKGCKCNMKLTNDIGCVRT